jgi:tetratricopeptide (TPR) repeat protein
MTAPTIADPYTRPTSDVVRVVSEPVTQAILRGTRYDPSKITQYDLPTEEPGEKNNEQPFDPNNFVKYLENIGVYEQDIHLANRMIFLLSNGAYQQLLDEFTNALKMLKEPSPPRWRALRGIAAAHQRLYWTSPDAKNRQIHATEGEKSLLEALRVAVQIRQTMLEIPVRNSLAALYGENSNPQKAYQQTIEVLKIYAKIRKDNMNRDLTRSYGLALDHKAKATLQLGGDLDDAIQDHKKAIKVWKQLKPFDPFLDSPAIANAYASIGAILRNQGRIFLAGESFLEATDILGPLDDVARRPEQWVRMFTWLLEAARLFVESGAPLRAIEPFQLAISMVQSFPEDDSIHVLKKEFATAENLALAQPRLQRNDRGVVDLDVESTPLEVAPSEKKFDSPIERVSPKSGLVSTAIREMRDRRESKL